MKIIYIAEDGTKFDDEDNCRFYELDKKMRPYITKNVKGYSMDGIEIPIGDNYEDWYDECDYIVIYKDLTDEEKKFWRYECGIYLPELRGFYRYDKEEGDWISYSTDKEKFEKKWAAIADKVGI